jgi:hypothetical protein
VIDSSNGLTVLVVEDDWLVRADIVLGLQQEGWMVLEASTGDGALKVLLESNTVDPSHHRYWPCRCYDRLGCRGSVPYFPPRGPSDLCIRGPEQRCAPGPGECLSEQASRDFRAFGGLYQPCEGGV